MSEENRLVNEWFALVAFAREIKAGRSKERAQFSHRLELFERDLRIWKTYH